MSAPTNLFPSIGDIAEQTDKLVLSSDHPQEGVAASASIKPSDGNSRQAQELADSEDDGQEKVVQEIESLCMRCEEQVRPDPLNPPLQWIQKTQSLTLTHRAQRG